MGFSRDAAARISFLMSIPVTAGAVVFKMAKLIRDGVPDGLVTPMIVGIVTSGLAGWLAVWGTIRLVRTRSFLPFVVYRCALGRRGAGHRRHRLALTVPPQPSSQLRQSEAAGPPVAAEHAAGVPTSAVAGV